MNAWLHYDFDGEIVTLSESSQPDEPPPSPGTAVLPRPGGAHPATHWVSGGIVVEYTAAQSAAKANPPPYSARWSNAEMRYIDTRSFAERKAAKWVWAKRERRARLDATASTAHGLLDADAASRAHLIEAAMYLRAAAPTTTVTWTRSDNTAVELDQIKLSQVLVALGARSEALHARARFLRAQIEAATTDAQLDAVEWGA